MVVNELNDRDMANRSTIAERLIGIFPDDVIILMIDEAVSINRIFATGQRKSPYHPHQWSLHNVRVPVLHGVSIL
jgi:hypothetical protein